MTTAPINEFHIKTDNSRNDLLTIFGKAVLKDRYLLKNEGFDTLIQEVSPSRPQLIATLKGKGGGRSLMLNGHLDNDSITASWK